MELRFGLLVQGIGPLPNGDLLAPGFTFTLKQAGSAALRGQPAFHASFETPKEFPSLLAGERRNGMRRHFVCILDLPIDHFRIPQGSASPMPFRLPVLIPEARRWR